MTVKNKKIILATLIATGLTCLILFAPDNAEAAPLLKIQSCVLSSNQPLDPVEMNTVFLAGYGYGSLTKTIAVEKNNFDCADSPTGKNNFIKTVSLYTKIIDYGDITNIGQYPKIAFNAVECTKSPDGTPINIPGYIAGCNSIPIEYVPAETLPALKSCVQIPVTIPVEMNTVVLSETDVKTMESEKELYKCTLASDPKQEVLKEVITFTRDNERVGINGDHNIDESIDGINSLYTTCQELVNPSNILNSMGVKCGVEYINWDFIS